METVSGATALYMDKRVKRAWELDFTRGLAVVLMCFDHLMYNLSALRSWFGNFSEVDNPVMNWLYSIARKYWNTGYYTAPGLRFFGHHIFVFIFLFLVGVSCAFSRDNVKRGSMLFFVSLAFTGVTMALKAIGIMPLGVVFGILHCISLCILISAAIDLLTDHKRTKWLNMYLPLVLGVLICAVAIANKFWIVNWDPYFDSSYIWSYISGIDMIGYGDDWFGILPNLGAVLIGLYWGKAAYPGRRSLLPRLDGKWNKPFKFVGRHALIFYLAHQVALADLVILLGLCLGYKLRF